MVNKFIAIGRLTRDPELRNTSSGSSVTGFSLAINEGYKDKSGEWKDKTVFTEWVVWNGSGENLCKLAHKGDLLYAEGKYALEEWDDNEGNKRTKPRFTALLWKILTPKKKVEEDQHEVEKEVITPEPAKKRGRPSKAETPKPPAEEDDSDDESIPF